MLSPRVHRRLRRWPRAGALAPASDPGGAGPVTGEQVEAPRGRAAVPRCSAIRGVHPPVGVARSRGSAPFRTAAGSPPAGRPPADRPVSAGLLGGPHPGRARVVGCLLRSRSKPTFAGAAGLSIPPAFGRPPSVPERNSARSPRRRAAVRATTASRIPAAPTHEMHHRALPRLVRTMRAAECWRSRSEDSIRPSVSAGLVPSVPAASAWRPPGRPG